MGQIHYCTIIYMDAVRGVQEAYFTIEEAFKK